MDGTLLVIGIFIALGGLISIFLIWGDPKQLRAEEKKFSDSSISKEIPTMLKNNENVNCNGSQDYERRHMLPGAYCIVFRRHFPFSLAENDQEKCEGKEL